MYNLHYQVNYNTCITIKSFIKVFISHEIIESEENAAGKK